MKGEKPDIGQLYKDTFDNFEINRGGNSEWAAIETKLAYHNFLYFGLYNFNIYYALLIAGSVVLNVIFGLGYYSKNKNDNLGNIISIDSTQIFDKQGSLLDETLLENRDTNIVSSSNNKEGDHKIEKMDLNNVEATHNQVSPALKTGQKQVNPKKTIDAEVVKLKSGKIEHEQPNYNIDSLPSETNEIIVTDSLAIFETRDTIADSLDIPVRKERKTIIIKPPDVVKRDTVIILKKRKK